MSPSRYTPCSPDPESRRPFERQGRGSNPWISFLVAQASGLHSCLLVDTVDGPAGKALPNFRILVRVAWDRRVPEQYCSLAFLPGLPFQGVSKGGRGAAPGDWPSDPTCRGSPPWLPIRFERGHVVAPGRRLEHVPVLFRRLQTLSPPWPISSKTRAPNAAPAYPPGTDLL